MRLPFVDYTGSTEKPWNRLLFHWSCFLTLVCQYPEAVWNVFGYDESFGGSNKIFTHGRLDFQWLTVLIRRMFREIPIIVKWLWNSYIMRIVDHFRSHNTVIFFMSAYFLEKQGPCLENWDTITFFTLWVCYHLVDIKQSCQTTDCLSILNKLFQPNRKTQLNLRIHTVGLSTYNKKSCFWLVPSNRTNSL